MRRQVIEGGWPEVDENLYQVLFLGIVLASCRVAANALPDLQNQQYHHVMHFP
ncbi:hypothetical protein HV127_25770 [Klebsiella sp. RHBSTW-00215]|uniref:hypothetical protein n=1 Tax=Klebsiella sp. RHBSTW-00215 TaxID=2742640 RepID=UPI0015F64265|nr:hypothetical protein [Klebsiella sp. RHBSTW-00215]MBA7934623.1 hypothetical protein [Klebsiella sp. RHBSTW-00215]